MKTPLYAGYNSPRNPQKGLDGHRGLFFDRFFNKYNDAWIIPKPRNDEDSQEKQWIDSIAGNCGNENQLKTNAKLQRQLCTDLNGQSKAFKNNWHFVTGMGNPHPIENGMSWHPTLGVPYLTGASVKGLVRAFAEEWEGLSKDEIHRWFGSDHKATEKQEEENQAGCFIFFDALPVAPVKLHIDIMTPHMGNWYSHGGDISSEVQRDENNKAAKNSYEKALPADWHDPIIIPFLVVKETTLQFNIAPRPNVDNKLTASNEALEKVYEILEQALEFIGAGAKTAVGYGRFEEDIEYKKQFQSIDERIITEVEQYSISDIVRVFGKEKNKLKISLDFIKSNDDWNKLLEQLKSKFGNDLDCFKNNKKQEKLGFRAYKTIYNEWQDWTPPDWDND